MGKRFIIGIDEAGYGPKLGPLTIAATAWSVPEEKSSFDFWTELEEVATDNPYRGDVRLHVADSKKVYSSGKGLKNLERSVLSFASLAGLKSASLTQIVGQLCESRLNSKKTSIGKRSSAPESFGNQPWYQNRDLSLPLCCKKEQIARDVKTMQQTMEKHGLQLEAVAVDVVCPELFNTLTLKRGNKSELLTHRSLQLIKKIRPSRETPTQILADKHGGRNRYHEHLLQAFPDQFFFTEKESGELSSYREGKTTISFGVKSEKYFPVAVASMFAKYVREICMELFNQFWIEKMPGLKPTKGYPQDAARFRADVEDLLPEVCGDENIFWRNR